MTLAIQDKWVWDSWYAFDGHLWHCFFLQADKSLKDPDLRHWHVSIGHATSRDLRHWQHLGRCFAPAEAPAWDDMTTWTGSVIRGEDGQWHLFYTGTSRADQGKKQRLGHAVSDNLHDWQRVGQAPIVDIDPDIYEEYDPARWHDRAFRDPWVIADPDGDGYLMFFTARQRGIADTRQAGAIGLATSKDLFAWQLQPPVYQGAFGELEVPQVFEHEGRWYCLFCTSARHWSQHYTAQAGQRPVSGTHYLVAEHPRGPWHVAPGPFLDGAEPCRRYAARIVPHADGLQLLGFLDQRDGAFVGEIADPQAVLIDAQGRLQRQD